jgi:menaquinone-dependent protoporphyrinogen oxidase
MSEEFVSRKPISRRSFLKVGCLTTAAGGLAVCGVSMATPIPDPSSIELPSFSYGVSTLNNRVLIIYASALGSTAGVAAEIGKTLGAGGFSVDVKPVRENPQLDGYQAVLVGSAVQHGNWLPEAVEFVKSNQDALRRVPVVVFTMHITNLGNDANSRKNRLAFLDEVRPLLQPVEEVSFSGKFDRRGAALLLPGLLARLVPPMDFRHWKKIRTWAEGIGPRLLQKA